MPELTIAWTDPHEIARAWRSLSGAAFLQRLREGTIALPPILELFGIREGDGGEGWIEFRMRPQAYMMNLSATLHGGALATLIDSALTCALVTKLPQGYGCTTIDLQMRFFRPARMSAELLTARADVIHAGRTLGSTQGTIVDARGKTIVHATSSLAIAPIETLTAERRGGTQPPGA